MKRLFIFTIIMALGAGLALAQPNGSGRKLNPQPLPPGIKVALNPQPLPPGIKAPTANNKVNPQPLPPGSDKTVTSAGGGTAK